MADDSEKIAQFTAITGVPEDRARFYLESSAGQLEVALSRYYEHDGGAEEDVVEVPATGSDSDSATATAADSTPTKHPKPKSRNSNFATLNTIARSSDEDEEEGQAFYAGGSEHSGQQVLGPPKKRDIVADMFKSVQEHGVEILDQGAGTSSRAFKGTGYKLGATESDTVVVPGTSEPPPPSEVTLKLWRDGFSVDDGELRAYTDPANRSFLESIKRGEIPHELRQGNSEIHLAMEDHRMEAFKQGEGVKKLTKPFTGHGYTLGSPTPPVVGASCDEDKPVNEERAKKEIKLDTNKPVTHIQIRLADGTRLIGEFNHEHTIAQVRNYILTARPQYQIQPFNLLSTYPSKILDESQTLEEAGLLNAAIMQKLL